MLRFLLAALLAPAAANAAGIAVVAPPAASPVEKLAARELAAYLGKLYPGDTFAVQERPAADARAVFRPVGARSVDAHPSRNSRAASAARCPSPRAVAT